MRHLLPSAVLVLSLFNATGLAAADAAPDERAADHAALRTLLERVTTALNQRDLPALTGLLAPTCSVVTVDQSRSTSPAQLQGLFDQWFSPGGGIASLTFKPTPDGPAVFLDERTAVATGTSDDIYVLQDGRTVVVPQRWSATVVKGDGGWQVAALHSGVNLMDNPVLATVRATGTRMAWIMGVVTGACGALIGWLVGRRRRPA